MTVETCVKMCSGAGYSIAGLEYASQCFCGNSLPATASPTPGVVGDCNAACTGNSNEICGDASLLSLYKKCTGGSCQNAQFGLVGEVGSLGGSSGSTGSASSPPPATSVSAVAHEATSPASVPTGKLSPSGSTPDPVATTTPSVAPSTPASTSAPSSGSSSSNTTVLPSGWSAAGCYSDNLDTRALTGIHLAWFGTPITASNCAEYCDKQGFSMSGVEFSTQCFCGNNLQGGSSPISTDKCNMPCAGDASQVCGGSLALNIATKSNGRRRRAHMRRHNVVEAGKV